MKARFRIFFYLDVEVEEVPDMQTVQKMTEAIQEEFSKDLGDVEFDGMEVNREVGMSVQYAGTFPK